MSTATCLSATAGSRQVSSSSPSSPALPPSSPLSPSASSSTFPSSSSAMSKRWYRAAAPRPIAVGPGSPPVFVPALSAGDPSARTPAPAAPAPRGCNVSGTQASTQIRPTKPTPVTAATEVRKETPAARAPTPRGARTSDKLLRVRKMPRKEPRAFDGAKSAPIVSTIPAERPLLTPERSPDSTKAPGPWARSTKMERERPPVAMAPVRTRPILSNSRPATGNITASRV
mmetsp:Transcript_11618/g.26645  ORF Transcript_11618/g.26645 Transcript_11618/m.26645 type:complete len:229 (+) Transcript_11618:60-746(+)